MKKNKSNKKKIILISWGLLFTIVMIVLLSMLLFSLQSKSSVKQEPVSKVETNNQQEQKTYNMILNKIDKEVNKLIKPKSESSTTKLKYPPKTVWNPDGTVNQITELDQDTGNYFKTTYYNPDGTIKEVITY